MKPNSELFTILYSPGSLSNISLKSVLNEFDEAINESFLSWDFFQICLTLDWTSED